MKSYEQIVNRIITLNHAWKLSRDEFGAKNAITEALRHQKSSWQATLIRDFPSQSEVIHDHENSKTHGEVLLSISLKERVTVNGIERSDAEHMPLRVAKELFTPNELNNFLSGVK